MSNLKLSHKLEAERVIWAYLSKMSITDGNPKFSDADFENEMMECWQEYLKYASKRHSKILKEINSLNFVL